MLSVSVVIPVYNQAALIGRALAAILRGSVTPLEVIVVNDGSNDLLDEAVDPIRRETLTPIRVVNVPHGGPGRARDVGWREALGGVVAFTDADAEPDPDWIQSAMEGFDADSIGAIEGKVVSSGVPRIFTHQVKNLTGGRFMTANMFYRRDVIEQVGGFKSRYREDSDLAFSVLEAGYTIKFIADSVVFHPPREERWSFYFEKANRKRFEALLFKNHPQVAPLYIPRVQPTELLIIGGEILSVLAIFLGAWSLTAGLVLLLIGLPKRIAAWLDGRQYSGREYLIVWAMTLVLVPVEAYYHWSGRLRPPH